MEYIRQAFGSRGQAWEGRGDAMGRVSEKSRMNASFKAVPAAPWGPLRRLWATFDSLFGASGRPLDDIFIVFPNHVLDVFLMDYSFVLGTILA